MNPLVKGPNATGAPAANPEPTNAPVRAWVVDTGNPSLAANKTVDPAPRATARAKRGEATSESGTSPFPPNFAINPCAKNTAVIPPNAVAKVAQLNARR